MPTPSLMPSTGLPKPRSGTRAMIAAVTIAALAAACSAGSGGTPSQSAAPTTSTSPSATPSPVAEKKPASDIPALLARLYLALNFDDADALAALTAPGAMHSVYFTDGHSGEEVAQIGFESYDPAADPMVAVAPWPLPAGSGASIPLIAGNAVAVPVRYQYPDRYYYGFDLLTVVPVSGGYLLGNGATICGSPEGDQDWLRDDDQFDPDPAMLVAIEAEVAGWNADDTEAVMATYTEDAAFWDGLAGPDRNVHTGDDLRQFVAETLWIQVEISGPQVSYGTFVASPNRLTSSTDSADGISVHELREGQIALHVWAPG